MLWERIRFRAERAEDVYKRQEHSSIVSRELIPFFVIVLFNLCMGFLGGPLGILAAGIVDVAAGCPVSYTHLDVYKRQIPRSCPQRSGRSCMR